MRTMVQEILKLVKVWSNFNNEGSTQTAIFRDSSGCMSIIYCAQPSDFSAIL